MSIKLAKNVAHIILWSTRGKLRSGHTLHEK